MKNKIRKSFGRGQNFKFKAQSQQGTKEQDVQDEVETQVDIIMIML